MIIDAHTHLFPEEVQKNRSSFCRRDEGFRMLYENERARLASLEDLLRSMDRDEVEKSVICGFPWKDPVLCREGNDFLLHCGRRYPDRLIPFACPPLRSSRLAERELERCLSLGMGGIGELAFYQQEISTRDIRRLSAILGSLSKPGIPLLLHANEPVGHDYPGKSLQGLRPIYQLLLALPEMNIILAHWGGGFFFYELMPEVARAARRVYYDTAASPFLYRPLIYRMALKIVGPGRILFGSDYPLLPPGRYFDELKRIRLSERDQALIKGRNAQRLLLPKTNSMMGPGDHV
jgi:predicted TIM-barrel fold metal-dependent hydrolase